MDIATDVKNIFSTFFTTLNAYVSANKTVKIQLVSSRVNTNLLHSGLHFKATLDSNPDRIYDLHCIWRKREDSESFVIDGNTYIHVKPVVTIRPPRWALMDSSLEDAQEHVDLLQGLIHLGKTIENCFPQTAVSFFDSQE